MVCYCQSPSIDKWGYSIMANLELYETELFEKLFNKGGYVITEDFTNPKFSQFFKKHGIYIDDGKYSVNGKSKMKRLRAFWEIEPNQIVGKVLEALLKYALQIEKIDEKDSQTAYKIIYRLQGKTQSENSFLNQKFDPIHWKKLNIEDEQFEKVLQQRIDEIQKAFKGNAPLSVIFLCGSTLEGLLLNVIMRSQNQKKFNQAKSSPKDKSGKVKKFQDWSLKDMIDVAHEVKLLDLDVKKHSHALRDFRNYIHPLAQSLSNFFPDIETAKISWQVLQAAISQIIKNTCR